MFSLGEPFKRRIEPELSRRDSLCAYMCVYTCMRAYAALQYRSQDDNDNDDTTTTTTRTATTAKMIGYAEINVCACVRVTPSLPPSPVMHELALHCEAGRGERGRGGTRHL